MGRVDPTARRDDLIRAEAERLGSNPPPGPSSPPARPARSPRPPHSSAPSPRCRRARSSSPVSTPGSTMPAGQAIGDEGTAPPHGHPQFGLRHLLPGSASTARGRAACEPAGHRERDRLISEALRPAETTETWAGFRATACEPRSRRRSPVSADRRRQRAGGSARHRPCHPRGAGSPASQDRPGNPRPDARPPGRGRIAALGAWRSTIPPARRLDRLPGGIFARLLAEAVLGNGDPVKLLALLKHPFAAFGMARAACRRAARLLEIALFRGRRVSGGIAGLAEALAAARGEVEGGRRAPAGGPQEARARDWGCRRLVAACRRSRPGEGRLRDGAPLATAGATDLRARLSRPAAIDRQRRPPVAGSGRRGARPLARRARRRGAASHAAANSRPSSRP